MMIGDSLPRCSITAETEFRGPPQKKKKAIKPNVEYLRVIYYMRENAEKWCRQLLIHLMLSNQLSTQDKMNVLAKYCKKWHHCWWLLKGVSGDLLPTLWEWLTVLTTNSFQVDSTEAWDNSKKHEDVQQREGWLTMNSAPCILDIDRTKEWRDW